MNKKLMILGLIIFSIINIKNSQSSEIPSLEKSYLTDDKESSVDERISQEGWWNSQPKEMKMLYTNLTAAAAISIWGLATWDYNSVDFHTANEGWFEQDSKYGGADKCGHFLATYTFADALTGL
jgi:hypothetical protein